MTALLEVKDVGKTFPLRGGVFSARRGETRALGGVSFSLLSGHALGVVGESGSGKSTLARILAGFLPASRGLVLWEGQPQSNFSRRQWAPCVQMVFQDPSASLNPKLSVGTQLEEGLAVRRRWSGDAPSVEEALAEVGLPPMAQGHYPHEFSGGQKQRIAIARALAVGPRLLIADEPVSSLDLSVQAQILNLLMDLKEKRGLSVILISHDLTVVRWMTDEVLILDGGKVVESGLTETVLSHPAHSVTQSLMGSIPALLK